MTHEANVMHFNHLFDLQCEIQNSISQQVTSQSHTYTFYLSVRRLVCKSTEDIELLFTLYDHKQSKPFSENFVIKCTREMMVSDTEKLYNFRALFTVSMA